MAPSRRLFMGTPAGDVEIPALPETGAAAGTQPFFDGNDWQNDSYLPHGVNDFRLTLVSGSPVADSNDTTTVYWTPYTGNRIGLYDGTRWKIHTTAEISLALGTMTSGIPYDVFVYDNAGTKTLEKVAWTNTTTRATALVRQDGVWCKTGALTRRYVGTFYANTATETSDNDRRFLFNAVNRVPRWLKRSTTTDDVYDSATIRQWSADTVNQLAFVIGLADQHIHVVCACKAKHSSVGAGLSFGTALNSTTTITPFPSVINIMVADRNHSQTAADVYVPTLGYNYVSANQAGNGATGTWNGFSMTGLVWM